MQLDSSCCWEELQRGRQASQEGLRNFDRTAEELQELQSLHGSPSDPLVQRVPLSVPLTVLLDGLCPHEVGCLMRTCEAAGQGQNGPKTIFSYIMLYLIWFYLD